MDHLLMKYIFFYCVVLFSLALGACQPGGLPLLPPPALPTETSTPTPSLTPTRIWFPPTATSTPRPLRTVTPTPDWLAGVGMVVATDDFSCPGQWDTAVSEQGRATLQDGELTLAVQPGIYLFSLQKELLLSDFYAEITTRPSLCRGEDAYGFLVRANAVAYYRFALICNGTLRVERVSGGQRTILQPPVPSGDAPPGAPADVRLGVWAVGSEMRFFLNGRYQFTIQDASLKTGTLGVFVRANGATPVTVSFSNLVVRRVSYVSHTPSLTPTRTPIPTIPTLRK
jgi:hypothetical protein